MAPGQALGDPVLVGRIHLFGSAKAAAAFGVFGGQQMPFAGAGAHDLAGAGDFEPFGHRFLRSDTFGASHKFLVRYKRARTIGCIPGRIKRYFTIFGALN